MKRMHELQTNTQDIIQLKASDFPQPVNEFFIDKSVNIRFLNDDNENKNIEFYFPVNSIVIYNLPDINYELKSCEHNYIEYTDDKVYGIYNVISFSRNITFNVTKIGENIYILSESLEI